MLTRCLTSCCCPVANEEVDHPSESLLSNMQPQTPMTIATELPSRDTSSTRADAPNAIALTTATPLTREQEAELPPLVFASPAPAPTGSSEVVLDELVMRSAPPSDPKAIPQMQPRSAASPSEKYQPPTAPHVVTRAMFCSTSWPQKKEKTAAM